MKDALERRPQACILILDELRVAIRHGATTTIVDHDEIVLAKSERNMTRIVTMDGEYRVREPFHAALARLASVGMTQVHRCAAVNSRRVRQLVGRGQHRLLILLNDGRSVVVGRNYQPRVKRQFGGS
jgi:DNA-binding LytR/AlgR family response regulator